MVWYFFFYQCFLCPAYCAMRNFISNESYFVEDNKINLYPRIWIYVDIIIATKTFTFWKKWSSFRNSGSTKFSVDPLLSTFPKSESTENLVDPLLSTFRESEPTFQKVDVFVAIKKSIYIYIRWYRFILLSSTKIPIFNQVGMYIYENVHQWFMRSRNHAHAHIPT